MNNDDIYSWIVGHPKNYPGKQSASQPRTDPSVKPLDPKAQFHLIIRAMGEYVRQNLANGRGVNYKGFGAFAFQVGTQLVKPAQLSNFDITKDLEGQRQKRKHNHAISPCFVADKKLADVLIRHSGKEEIDKPKSQVSIYQKGFNMIYCNPTPLAASCNLDRSVAQAVMSTFARAVIDLTQLGKSMQITIGPVRIRIQNRNLTYSFEPYFVKQLNATEYQKFMKKSLTATKQHWQTPYTEKWSKSNLSQMISKPDFNQSNILYEKGLALKIMSLDLNTTEKVKQSYK